MELHHTPIQSVERVGPDAVDPSGLPVSPPNLPIDYLERFNSKVRNPNFADTIFAHIANGGTLITLAETWGVRHSDISGYLGKHPELMQQHTAAMMARDEWERERCLQELRAIMTVDIRQAYNADGTLKNVRDLPASLAAALQSVDTEETFEGSGDERQWTGFTKRVKFWDKAKAIELFMKKHGLLIERKQVTHTMRLEDLIHPANADVVDAQLVTEPEKTLGIARIDPVPGVLKSGNPSDSPPNFSENI